MQRRALLILAAVLGFLLPVIAPASLAAGSGSVTLALTPSAVTYGQPQHAAGTIAAEGSCSAGRTVYLQRRPSGAATWSHVATATSKTDGSFAFSFTPAGSSSYRARAPASGACLILTSDTTNGVVHAAVSLALGSHTVRAGGCRRGTIVVGPNKSGQHARLQQKGPSGWRTIAFLTLDGSSRAATNLCKGWGSIGKRYTYRATWPAQDSANAAGTSATSSLLVVEAGWMQRIDQLTRGRAVGVSIRSGGRVLYQRAQAVAFAPASNEKLLLSMALLDRFGPAATIHTDAAVPALRRGVVRGNLWVLGHGDPSTGKPEIARLAHAIAVAGVHKVTGSVLGSTGYFAHDWWAPGWRSFFPTIEVGLPSALTFLENHVDGRNVHAPERFAAQSLTRHLRRLGVKVVGSPGSAAAPAGLHVIASATSPSLAGLLGHMDGISDNFFAEVLGKRLAVARYGGPGTISHAAAAIASWTQSHGVATHPHDSSGLSYDDRVTPGGITRLLQTAEGEPWGGMLRAVLATPGHGTLEDRLSGVNVHAKTGTLDYISALSGWVWLSRLGRWAEFSILDRGMLDWYSKPMEDAIVRQVARYGH